MRRTMRITLGAVTISTMVICAAGLGLIGFIGVAGADSALAVPGVVLPPMSAEHGKALFASKGCVVCHSINGVGGIDAAPLDASSMDPAGNPFEFFARMLTAMTPMTAMQEDRLGHQVELDAAELGNLVAFIHDEATQESFSTKDVPADIQELIDMD